ncbi:MAG: hypothetical protein ACYDH4_07990 [Candidatus Cryosericum sp.]
MFSSILRLPEFDGDLKHLKKRYSSLDEDLAVLTKALHVWLCVQGKAGQSYDDGYVVMSDYGANGCFLYKVKHVACASMRGKGSRTGLRVICAYWPKSDTLEFIEIYFKGDSEREDQHRIRRYIKTVRR